MRVKKSSHYHAKYQNAEIFHRKQNKAARILATTLALSVTLGSPLVVQTVKAHAADIWSVVRYSIESTGYLDDLNGVGDVNNGVFYAEAGDVLYYADENGVVYKVTVDKDDLYTLPKGMVVSTVAAYDAYIASLAEASGGILLNIGVHYFEKDGVVFMFKVAEKGWFDLGDAEHVKKEHYDAYIAGLARERGGVWLDQGMHYFAKDGVVFVFKVDAEGWFDLVDAKQEDQDAYDTYIDGIRVAEGGFYAEKGDEIYYSTGDDVFMVTLEEGGLFKLPTGAVAATGEDYNAYIDGLRVTDGGFYAKTGDVFYYSTGNVFFMVKVEEGGLFKLPEEAVTASESDYDAYIDGLRVADGGFYANTGDVFYYSIGDEVFMAKVTADGLYLLPEEAEAVTIRDYDDYIDSLRVGDDGFYASIGDAIYYSLDDDVFMVNVTLDGLYKLPAGAEAATKSDYNAYIDTLRVADGGFYAETGDVFYYSQSDALYMITITADGLFILPEGAQMSDEAAFREYMNQLGAFYFDGGGLCYYQIGDTVFMAEAIADGWYTLPSGAGYIDASRIIINPVGSNPLYFEDVTGSIIIIKPDGKAYLNPGNLQPIADGKIISEPGTHYYIVPGDSRVYTATVSGDYVFVLPTEASTIDIYNNDRILTGKSGDFYFRSNGEWFHIRIVDSSSINILPEGLTVDDLTTTRPTSGTITTIGHSAAGTGTRLEDITITKINPDNTESQIGASSWRGESSSNEDLKLDKNTTRTLYKDDNGNVYQESAPGRIVIGVWTHASSSKTSSITLFDDYILSVRWQISGNIYHLAELSGVGIYQLGDNTDTWLGNVSVMPTGAITNPEDASNQTGVLGDIQVGLIDPASIDGEVAIYDLPEIPGELDAYQLKDIFGELETYQLREFFGGFIPYQLQEIFGGLIDYNLATNPGFLGGFSLDEITDDLHEYTLANNPGFLDQYTVYNPDDIDFENNQPPVIVVEDPELPLTDPPVEVIDISDEDVPLTDIPEVSLDLDDDDIPELSLDLDDDDIPLSELPETGVESGIIAWLLGLMGSMVGLSASTVAIKKTKKGKVD